MTKRLSADRAHNMNMPGFTAEASVYRTQLRYKMVYAPNNNKQTVLPASCQEELDMCGGFRSFIARRNCIRYVLATACF
jgi:hypothetical protein